MLSKEQKATEVGELREKLPSTAALIAIDYRGLSVEQANELRGKLRAAGEGQIEYRVAKNTLVRRAILGTSVEPLSQVLGIPSEPDGGTGAGHTSVFGGSKQRFGQLR